MAISETFEETCKKCGHKSEITVHIKENSFSFYETYHCAYCGLPMGDVKADYTPTSKLIEGDDHE